MIIGIEIDLTSYTKIQLLLNSVLTLKKPTKNKILFLIGFLLFENSVLGKGKPF